ncbi:hypothetical protein ASD04_06500 [Devosia sp. Root436]|jgi:DNA-binding NtrC family response regulator|uniref:response regulator n=1 Tax=Devosia sp. Root436 TaxID=1736537 RepID=UPI0006F3CE5F|nr:response regulator [Devosia sp. Root436]KQX40278.1 hypothetical protein ASD04_06500 [Devosia sp. Root436]
MLTGQTVLIIEDEFLIALDIQRILEPLGAGKTLFARTTAEAEELRALWPEIGVAVIEVLAHDAERMQLARALSTAGIPVVLTTADITVRHGLADLSAFPLLVKPVPEEAFTSAIGAALAARS